MEVCVCETYCNRKRQSFEKKEILSLYKSWGLIGGVEVQLYSFLDSALDWGEWQTSYSDRFTARKIPDAYEVGGCLGHRAGLRVFEMIEVSCCTRIRTPNRPVRSLFSIPNTLPGGLVRGKSNSGILFRYTRILLPFFYENICLVWWIKLWKLISLFMSLCVVSFVSLTVL